MSHRQLQLKESAIAFEPGRQRGLGPFQATSFYFDHAKANSDK